VLIAGCCLSLPSVAQQAYKSVDAKGNVTYSSEPPEGVVDTQPVTISDAPTPAQRQEALRRERQLQQAADNLARERAARDMQSQVVQQDAERAREEAKAMLEQAKVMQDSDWQFLGGGRRHLKESYFERVREAEEKLRAADDALNKTGR